MARSRCFRIGLASLAVLVAFVVFPARGQDSAPDLRQQALLFEKQGDWAKACSYYAYLLSKDRNQPELRRRFQICLRHFHRVRRHRDETYRYQVLNQDVGVALKLYTEIVTQIHAEYLEERKADYAALFRNGLEELRLALKDESFRREYLPAASSDAVKRFVKELQGSWRRQPIRDLVDAQQQVFRLALAARRTLDLRETVTVLELACGACNALDEHTCFLSPEQLHDDFTALRGQSAGIGIELGEMGHDRLITRVFINSPAARAGLVPGDRIRRIDRTAVAGLSLEEAQRRLRGKAGSTVELEVDNGQSMRILTLVRRALQISIADYRILDADAGIGYVHLVAFHENTLAELDQAIQQLEMQGMKVLLLDLRGNPGGLFESAVQVAERFLWEGAGIVGTHGRDRVVRRSSRNLNPSTLPLVLLVDGSTASAAEIVAGALKENGRATLVGQNTFGKGSVQHMIALKTIQAGGLRITWARFTSPLNHSYSGGVAPHVFVERSSLEFDEPRDEARLLARQILMMSR